MRRAPQRLFDLCVRTNMGQNETSNTVASSRLFFFLLFHSLCTFFFSKLSSAGLRVSAAPQPGCVCLHMCACVCAMRRDKRLHPPLRHRIPQRSATRSVWRAFHLSSTRSFLLLLLLLPLLLLFLPLLALRLLALTGGRKANGGMKGTRF